MNKKKLCIIICSTYFGAVVLTAYSFAAQRPNKNTFTQEKSPTGKKFFIPRDTVSYKGRALDLVLNNNHSVAFIKTDFGIESIDLKSKATHSFSLAGGTSQYGIAISPNGAELACSNAGSDIALFEINGDQLKLSKTIKIPSQFISGASYPCGLQFAANGKVLYACMSRDNCLAKIDLRDESITRIQTDPSPINVTLTSDGMQAIVSCQSESVGKNRETESSSGTNIPVDQRGIAVHGAADLIDLRANKVTARTTIGLLPGKPVIIGSKAYIANANSDDVSVLDIPSFRLETTWRVAPKNEFGASPNSIVRTKNDLLVIACGGANQLRIFNTHGALQYEFATPDYPIAVNVFGNKIAFSCAKGLGNSTQAPTHTARSIPSGSQFTDQKQTPKKNLGYSVFDSLATFSVIDSPELNPDTISLQTPTFRGNKSSHIAKAHLPSQIKHILYIIKENRTYDQVFGDMTDGDPYLINFGKTVTPNEHALADQFGLLTRYFCDSIISTDGHAWSTEANSNAYLERSSGGWTRSYPWGDDPLAISQSGAIWDDALAHGKTVRNYGEYVYGNLPSGYTYTQAFNDWKNHEPLPWKPKIAEKRLWSISDHNYPGWCLSIPDQFRADEYIRDYNSRIKKGIQPPDLTILYLEQDHTAGEASGMPTPQTMNADNDYAIGRVVEAISHSKYWKSTAIFIIEDDPQDGYDHIDGHRSICLIISPYSRRKAINRTYYDQAALLHTIEAFLHIPPMTRFDRNAPIMSDCFTRTPNFEPYHALSPLISLSKLNGSGHKTLQFAYPDESNDLALNHQIWDSIYPNRPYPIEFCPPPDEVNADH